jgi:hypothetical protein
MHDQHLTIRLATLDDVPALLRLAALDSAAPLAGRVLMAELGGVPIAAVALEGGAMIADPFEHTEDAVRRLSL